MIWTNVVKALCVIIIIIIIIIIYHIFAECLQLYTSNKQLF